MSFLFRLVQYVFSIPLHTTIHVLRYSLSLCVPVSSSMFIGISFFGLLVGVYPWLVFSFFLSLSLSLLVSCKPIIVVFFFIVVIVVVCMVIPSLFHSFLLSPSLVACYIRRRSMTRQLKCPKAVHPKWFSQSLWRNQSAHCVSPSINSLSSSI